MTATATDLFQLPPVPPSTTTVDVTPPDPDDDDPTPASVPAPPSGPPAWLVEIRAAHADVHGGAVRRLAAAVTSIPRDAEAVDLWAAWRMIYQHDPAGLWPAAVGKILKSAVGSTPGDISSVEGRALEVVHPLLESRLAASTVAAGLIHAETLSRSGVLGEISFTGRTGRFFFAEYRNLPDAVRAVAPPEAVAPKSVDESSGLLVLGPVPLGGRPTWFRAAEAAEWTRVLGSEHVRRKEEKERLEADRRAAKQRLIEESTAPDSLRANLRKMQQKMAEQDAEIARLKSSPSA